MNLQWYPGHMTKARRAMEDNLKLVDVIIEIRDARIPYSSANPDLKTLGQGKKRLIVLNKADLADPSVTADWEQAFLQKGYRPVSADSRLKKEAESVRKQLDVWAAEKSERDAKRGIRNRPVRVMVVGIPNVGKSTLINSLAGRASTKTGDKPGVTKGLQWIRLSRSVELMDTPGILWPKFDEETVGLHLALMGAISEEVIPAEELACYGIGFLEKAYSGALYSRYSLDPADPPSFLEKLAVKQGILKKGASPDTETAARRLLNDWQSGRLGRISLEKPEEFEA
ncbi:MAG: ribosome biogenesis GTPase YlqF [Lachnospiraceae bacterium]|nr:ribosome biogenesis GTPase YlqF [Lachnospiraceae bacterium]